MTARPDNPFWLTERCLTYRRRDRGYVDLVPPEPRLWEQLEPAIERICERSTRIATLSADVTLNTITIQMQDGFKLAEPLSWFPTDELLTKVMLLT